MDPAERQAIDAAVAEVYAAVQHARVSDTAAGLLQTHVVPKVEKTDMPFASLVDEECLDTLKWSEGLVPGEQRFVPLRTAQALFAKRAHVAPYDTRSNDGWEAITAIAIASQQFDFLANRDFDLAVIQRHVQLALTSDQMIERTIWALFGVRVANAIAVGDRSWIVPPTDERRSYVAVASQFTNPMIHAHSYLVVDRVAPAEDVRSGKRDALPARLISCLRAVSRADLLAFGPWFETLIMFPSRFAGFRTRIDRVTRFPHTWGSPSDDVELSDQLVAEVVALDALLESEPPLLKPYVRKLRLAVSRLATAKSRSEPADEMLDLMIALEALLSKKDGEKSEIKYRLGLRGAFVGGASTTDGRAATRKLLDAAYDLRSEIVHGAKQDPKISAPTVAELRTFVARVIRLSAHAIAQGQPLVEQVEAALMGDTAKLDATLAKIM